MKDRMKVGFLVSNAEKNSKKSLTSSPCGLSHANYSSNQLLWTSVSQKGKHLEPPELTQHDGRKRKTLNARAGKTAR